MFYLHQFRFTDDILFSMDAHVCVCVLKSNCRAIESNAIAVGDTTQYVLNGMCDWCRMHTDRRVDLKQRTNYVMKLFETMGLMTSSVSALSYLINVHFKHRFVCIRIRCANNCLMSASNSADHYKAISTDFTFVFLVVFDNVRARA